MKQQALYNAPPVLVTKTCCSKAHLSEPEDQPSYCSHSVGATTVPAQSQVSLFRANFCFRFLPNTNADEDVQKLQADAEALLGVI